MDIFNENVTIWKSAVKNVLPENISNTIEYSTEKAIDFVKKAWDEKDKLKERARKRLLELNKKIGKLLEKPEFDITEKAGLAGKKYIIWGKDGYSPDGFLNNNRKNITDIFKKNFETKVKMALHCLMSSTDLKSGEEITDVGFFSSLVEEVYEGTDLKELLDAMFARILENMANFTKGKSNWRFVQVNRLEINVDEMSRDDGVGEWIPLPETLEKKKALINPKNKDDECFKWCVTRAFFECKIHPERITDKLKEQSESFNWDKMSFPVDWNDITRFEKNNDMSVNVLGWNNGKVYIARKAKRKRKRHVNLFMIKKNGKKHFCLISSMSRLLRKEKQIRQRYYCDNCLNSRQKEEALEKHKGFCESFEACKTVPPKDNFMQFKNYKNQTSIPFRIYADSEAILKPVSGKNGEFQEHIPCGFCFHTVAESGEEFSPVLIRGKNCVDEFLDKLIEHVKNLQNRPKKPIIWEKGKREKFENQTHCWFCNEEIKGRKVADHCHFTGKFRGAAHVDCNLNARKPKFTPVFFHNLFN